MLLLAYQLVGDRELHIHQVDGDPVVIKCYPGHLDLCNVTTAFHQVQHSFSLQEGGSVELGRLGPCGVAFVVRCTFLAHDKARGCAGLNGRSFFEPMQSVLHRFLQEVSLTLPSFAEVSHEFDRRSSLDATRLVPKKQVAQQKRKRGHD